MPYVKIENNIVIQKQPYDGDYLLEVDDSIVCGMLHDGSSEYGVENFSLPVVVKTWDAIRDKRNIIISSCDWTQLSDSPLTDEETASWATYRQALRDITDDFATPDGVIWPESP